MCIVQHSASRLGLYYRLLYLHLRRASYNSYKMFPNPNKVKPYLENIEAILTPSQPTLSEQWDDIRGNVRNHFHLLRQQMADSIETDVHNIPEPVPETSPSSSDDQEKQGLSFSITTEPEPVMKENTKNAHFSAAIATAESKGYQTGYEMGYKIGYAEAFQVISENAEEMSESDTEDEAEVEYSASDAALCVSEDEDNDDETEIEDLLPPKPSKVARVESDVNSSTKLSPTPTIAHPPPLHKSEIKFYGHNIAYFTYGSVKFIENRMLCSPSTLTASGDEPDRRLVVETMETQDGQLVIDIRLGDTVVDIMPRSEVGFHDFDVSENAAGQLEIVVPK